MEYFVCFVEMHFSDLSIKQNWMANQIAKLLLDDSVILITYFRGHKHTHVVRACREVHLYEVWRHLINWINLELLNDKLIWSKARAQVSKRWHGVGTRKGRGGGLVFHFSTFCDISTLWKKYLAFVKIDLRRILVKCPLN